MIIYYTPGNFCYVVGENNALLSTASSCGAWYDGDIVPTFISLLLCGVTANESEDCELDRDDLSDGVRFTLLVDCVACSCGAVGEAVLDGGVTTVVLW